MSFSFHVGPNPAKHISTYSTLTCVKGKTVFKSFDVSGPQKPMLFPYSIFLVKPTKAVSQFLLKPRLFLLMCPIDK